MMLVGGRQQRMGKDGWGRETADTAEGRWLEVGLGWVAMDWSGSDWLWWARQQAADPLTGALGLGLGARMDIGYNGTAAVSAA